MCIVPLCLNVGLITTFYGPLGLTWNPNYVADVDMLVWTVSMTASHSDTSKLKMLYVAQNKGREK